MVPSREGRSPDAGPRQSYFREGDMLLLLWILLVLPLVRGQLEVIAREALIQDPPAACTLQEGSTLYLGGGKASLQVLPTFPATKVVFALSNACLQYTKTETKAPFSLYGDSGYDPIVYHTELGSDLVACSEPYKLVVTADTETLEMSFTVSDEAGCDFGCECNGPAPAPLVVTPTGGHVVLRQAEIANPPAVCYLESGSTVHLGSVGSQGATLEAVPGMTEIAMVKFGLWNPDCPVQWFERTESEPPYALFGNSDYYWAGKDYKLEPCGGPYFLTVTATSKIAGAVDEVISVSFTVDDNPSCAFGCTCNGPAPLPAPVPVAGPVPAPIYTGCGKMLKMYIIQDEDPSKLPLEKGHFHTIYADGAPVEKEVYFHDRQPFQRYNIAVETTTTDVSSIEWSGFYYPVKKQNKFHYQLDEAIQVSFKSDSLTNGQVYLMIPTTDQLIEGEYFLTVTSKDSNGAVCDSIELSFELLGNPQHEAIVESELTLQSMVWKDIHGWQEQLKSNGNSPEDLVLGIDDRPYQNDDDKMKRLALINYFKDLLYVAHEKLGAVFSIDPKAMGKWNGMKLFLDVYTGMKNAGTALGYGGGSWHSGLRSIALHPDGDEYNGLIYVSAMEMAPVDKGAMDAYYIKGEIPGPPIEDESALVEFRYWNGKGDVNSYRLLFRVEVPIYDHTIRQITFGVDNPLTTSVDESKLLYICHGDGSVESDIVGDGQQNNALGKILRMDPLDGKSIWDTSLSWGEYATWMNPFHDTDLKPGVIDLSDPSNPVFGSVPKETWALGFRNPHTMDWSQEGELIVGEACRDTFEEVNIVKEGGNYGWPWREGTWHHLRELDNVGSGKGMFYSAIQLTSDARCPSCNFHYPNIEWGHPGYIGMHYNSVALAGGHIIDNDSEIGSQGAKYFFTDFPFTGLTYFTSLEDLRNAKTQSPQDDPSDIQPADMWHVKCQLVNLASEEVGSVYNMMREAMIHEYDKYQGDNHKDRLNTRFGRDIDGTLYILSKENGLIYKILNSDPNGEFEEMNGLLVGEFESLPVDDMPNWETKTTSGNVNAKFITWTGAFSNTPGALGYYRIPIRIHTPGTYRFLLRGYVDNTDSTSQNDLWLRFPDSESSYGLSSDGSAKAYAIGSGKTPEVTSDIGGNGWFRGTLSHHTPMHWHWNIITGPGMLLTIDFLESKTYHFEIAPRAVNFYMDRFVFYNVDTVSHKSATLLENFETKS